MIRSTAISLLLFLGLNPLFGQVDSAQVTGSTSLDEIVILAKSPHLPGTFYLERDSIRSIQQANFSLGQYLATEPSVNIKQYGPAGIASPAFRGTGAGHTQVYWNGIPINSPLLGQSDLSLGTVGMFDKIQTIYGAGSLNQGPGGFGGALLLDSQHDPDWVYRTTSTAQLEGGSFGNFRGLGKFAYRNNRFSSRTRILYGRGENNFSYESGANAVPQTTEHSAVEQLSILQQFMYQVGRRRNPLTLQTWVSGMDRELPPSEFGSNLEEHQQDRSIRSQLGYKKYHNNKVVEAQLAHNYERLDYQQEVTGLSSTSNFHSLILRLNTRPNIEQFGTHLLQGWGLQLAANHALFSSLDNPVTEGWGTAHLRSQLWRNRRWEWSSLLRTSWQGNRFSLPFGVLSAVWTPKWRHRFHANVSRNQRFPTLNDRFWDPGGNPDLLPESGYGTEVGWMFHPGPLAQPGQPRVIIQANAFANLVNQWIQWIPSTGNLWTPQNVHQVGNLGGELFFNFKHRVGLTALDFQAAYTFVRSQSLASDLPNDQSVGKQLIYTPAHRANFRASARHKGWSLIAQQSLNSRSFITRDNQSWLEGYGLTDLRLSKYWIAVERQFELYGAVNNLFNRTYRTVVARPMPGRNFVLGLRMNLNQSSR